MTPKTHELNLPPLEDLIVEKKLLGLLFGDGNLLKYYPFGKVERYPDKIVGLISQISAVLVTPEEIYYGLRDGDISGLFGSFAAGRDRDDKVLISKADMDGRNIISFHSLFEYDGKLYGLAQLEGSTYVILHFDEFDGKLVIGDTLLRYGFNIYPAQAIPVPGELKSESGKYPFSVISCANLRYLDLNGEEIAGTKVQGRINRIALLSSTPETVTVVYSGYGLNAIKQAEIDLEEKTAETYVLVYGLSDTVSALAPVYDKKLHEKLISVGIK